MKRLITLAYILTNRGCIQKGFATGQTVWDIKFLSQINKNLKILK